MTLVENLARGWTQTHDEQALGFIQRWKEKFQTDTQVKQRGDNCLRFLADLSSIRLHGMGEVQCVLLGGEGPGLTEALRDFKQRLGEAGGVPFVLATSHSAYTQAYEALPFGRFLILSPPQLEQLLATPEPLRYLKLWLREQISLRRLVPFNHLLSVEGGMFFGRRNELDKLYNESDLSFAVAGPGRIGKTSLIKQFQRKLVHDRDPQALRTFYVDFYQCSKEPNTIAQLLAMKLEASRRSLELSYTKLPDFLQYLKTKLGGTIHLLLDEVDNVCQGEVFDLLGEAAKLGYCRLILIGRGGLLRMMLYSDSQLNQRLQLLQLNPLDEPAARNLLLDPLADLGFKVDDPERLSAQVLRLTGRLPNQIQFFARKLAELAIDEQSDTISLAQVERLKWDFETTQFFISPLQGEYLEDAEVRLIALLLLKEQLKEITPGPICALALRWGLPIDEMHALRICNELVIHNVLVWNKGRFCLANEALAEYAERLGILDSALETARRSVQLTSTQTSPNAKLR
ncbi:MAG: hypothetical protein HYR56_35350 [Acidobacteria bacterium]|nr:hypothetical protein [Acidobacteriota bacterium]MBI3426232.1 hypothetical protein [Acidobacteriota bacterium]